MLETTSTGKNGVIIELRSDHEGTRKILLPAQQDAVFDKKLENAIARFHKFVLRLAKEAGQ